MIGLLEKEGVLSVFSTLCFVHKLFCASVAISAWKYTTYNLLKETMYFQCTFADDAVQSTCGSGVCPKLKSCACSVLHTLVVFYTYAKTLLSKITSSFYFFASFAFADDDEVPVAGGSGVYHPKRSARPLRASSSYCRRRCCRPSSTAAQRDSANRETKQKE